MAPAGYLCHAALLAEMLTPSQASAAVFHFSKKEKMMLMSARNPISSQKLKEVQERRETFPDRLLKTRAACRRPAAAQEFKHRWSIKSIYNLFDLLITRQLKKKKKDSNPKKQRERNDMSVFRIHMKVLFVFSTGDVQKASVGTL